MIFDKLDVIEKRILNMIDPNNNNFEAIVVDTIGD